MFIVYIDTTSLCLQARVKPKQSIMEMSVNLDTACVNYDSARAKQIAVNCDGTSASKGGTENSFPT